MTNVPPVRPLEPIPVEVEGQQYVILRDPMHFIESDVSVSVPAYLLLCLIDGTRDIDQLCAEFEKRFGNAIERKEVQSLVDNLDKVGLLQNQRYLELQREAFGAFNAAEVRRAAHAGSAYADDPQVLCEELDGYYAAALEEEPNAPFSAETPIRGLVAPHIDPRVGGPCAAQAFRLLAESSLPPADVFVLFGTAHQPGRQLFSVLDKPFETPLGRVPADSELIAELDDKTPGLDLHHDQYLHKYEHSLEFQLIFLQHLYGSEILHTENRLIAHRPHAYTILPVLVGSFYDFIQSNTLPSVDEEMEQFTNALRETLGASGKTVCFIIGADLSHMGKKFGDTHGCEEERITMARKKDLEMLVPLTEDNPEAFFRHLQIDGDQQKVCGLPPVYTALNVLGSGHPAKLLKYDVAVEEATESFVTFASMAIM